MAAASDAGDAVTLNTLGFEVEAGDVVKLVLQFLHEQGLSNTAGELQRETGVALNTVDNRDHFAADIRHGRWEAVLPVVSRMKLPPSLLISLYEQVVLELIEVREVDLAREMLRSAAPLQLLRTEEPERYLTLDSLAQRPVFDTNGAYGTDGKERRRAKLAERLVPHAIVVPPSRLLATIGQSLKWMQHNGQLPKGSGGGFDLFRGAARTRRAADLEERVVKKLAGQIRYGAQCHAESSLFSPDGAALITGSVDGFIEVWDSDTCRLRRDLPYQATPDDERFMMHDKSVLCLVLSRDGEFLASGSQDGKIKVWKLATGKLLRKFDRAHTGGVTCLAFARDGSQVASGSFDQLARVHGLKSGKTLKDFRGHSSYVNAVCYAEDGTKVLSASSDGTIKVWELRTQDCALTFRLSLGSSHATAETSIHTLVPMPGTPDHFLAVNRTSTAHVVTLQGQVVRSFSSGKATGGDFVCGTVSPQGKWAYCAGEDGKVYVFDLSHSEGAQLEHIVKVADKDLIGICHHPHRNLLATHAADGMLKLWKP
mmetsp:Transcript_23707/g.63746  ORF Transcript_23707/g.63746 Transcript_23707/m.63746 type:complete len:540 (+) Transcript_23707:406-2025(+)